MRANRYVSYLAAEIEPKAISTLNEFERAATRVLDKIQSRTAGGMGGQALGIVPTRNAKELTKALDGTSRSVDKADASMKRATHSASAMGVGFQRASQALNVVQGPLGPLAGRLSALSQVMQTLTGYSLAGVLGGGGAFALGSIASQYQNVTDRLRPLFESQTALNNAMNDVVGIAQRSRQALEPVVELYAKMTLAGRAAGISDERTARITELASKAAKLSGGAAETQKAGLTQFAQGFGSGTLSGEELKSIKENTLALAKALSDGLGRPIAELKALGAEGKLTPQVIAQALEYAAVDIEAAYARMPKRIGSSLTELSNNFTVFIGRTDETVGATTILANGLSILANNLDVVTIAAVSLAAAMGGSAFAGGVKTIQSFVGAQLAFNRAVKEGNAVVIGSAQAQQMKASYLDNVARSLATSAEIERDSAKTAVQSAQQHRTAVLNQIGALDKQIAAQRKVQEQYRLIDKASIMSGGAGRADLVKQSTNEVNAAMRARMLSQQQLVAVDAELAAADARLIASTTALNGALAGEVVAMNAANAAAANLTRGKVILQNAMNAVSRAGASLVGFLGGPWGVAFTVAAAAATYLATQTNHAAEAAQRFEGDQDALLIKLGFTTDALYKQGDAARSLAADLARVNLIKAKDQFRDVRVSAADKLNNAAFFTTTNLEDTRALRDLADVIARGNGLSAKGYSTLRDVVKKYPSLAKDTEFQQTIIGLRVGTADFRDAISDAEKFQREFDKPRVRPNILGGGTAKPETAAARRARLNREAKIEGASDGLARARAELAAARAEGPKTGESDKDYIDRLANMQRGVDALAASTRGGTAANDKAAAALRRVAVELETASDKRDKLMGIMDAYTDDSPIKRLEQIRDKAEKAKRAIDDLVGEKVEGYSGAFTQKDADKLKGQIDQNVIAQETKPLDDALEAGRQNITLLELQARGMGDLAAITQQRIDLEKQMPKLTAPQVEQLRQQYQDAQRLNDVIEERNQIIQNNARFLGEVRDAGRDAIRAFLGGDIKGGIKGFAKALKDAYLDAKANEIAIKIFGDPEKKYIDKMTRGLDGSAEQLNTSAKVLDQAGASLESAAAALSGASQTGDGLVRGPNGTMPAGMAEGRLLSTLDDISGVLGGQSEGGVSGTNEDIVVTGTRKKKIELPPLKLPGGVDSVLGELGLGDLVNIGGAVKEVVQSLKKGKVGDAIGAALQTAGQYIPQLGAALAISEGISSLVTKKRFAGGLFGVLGNVLFGKKPPVEKGSTAITGLDSSRTVHKRVDTSGLATSVQDGLRRITEALGGTASPFAVSIGRREDRFVVDRTGRGETKGSNVQSFATEQEAIQAAIMDALRDGAIAGIREGTKRLLAAGRDLDSALEKATKFEDVFKQLRKIKDPVGFAVDELNKKFVDLISIFKEAQASTEEWAQLEELYGLERADALKEASNNAVSVLEDFIKGMTSGPESPLSRRTVYDNARTEVDKFRGDIMAGKVVDQDALVEALNNFNAASETINGSREQRFSDFADILALATAAKANVGTPAAGGALPGSPFDTLAPIAQEQLDAQLQANLLLEQIRLGLLAAGGGGGLTNQLPGALAGGGGGGGGSGGWGGGGTRAFETTRPLYSSSM